MTEGKERTGVFLVGPAIAHVDALFVLLIDDIVRVGRPFGRIPPCARIGVKCVGAHFLERGGPCERHLAARGGISREDGCKCPTGLRTDEPALHNGRYLLFPRHGHGIARDIDIDEVLVDLGQRLDEAVLCVGQFVSLAVVPLTILIVAFVQSPEHHHIVGSPGLPYGLGYKLVGRPVVFELLSGAHTIVIAGDIAHIPTGIVYRDAVSQPCLQTLKGRNLPLHFQRRTAAPDSHHLDGILAHHKHTFGLCRVDGQHPALVLEQHDAFFRNLPGSPIMVVGAQETMRAVAVHRRAIVEAEHAPHFVVELFRGVFAFVDALQIGVGKVVVVVGIAGPHRQSVGPRPELHVESVPDGLLRVVGSSPVAHHHAVKLPVAFQYLVECPLVMAVVLVLVEVVGPHDGPCLALLHSGLEGRKIDFMQGAVADDDIHLMAVFLVVVEAVVLHTGRHALRLQPLDVGHHHRGSQVRVFAHILEVASVEWCAIDVDTGAENHVLVSVACLLAQTLAIEATHPRIPRCSKTGECRKSHAGVVGLSCLFPFVP